jgi:hypothetical protein
MPVTGSVQDIGQSMPCHHDTLAAQDNTLFASRMGKHNSNEGTTFVFNVAVPCESKSNPGFTCVQCGKTYRQKGNLSTHMRLECGKEPQFACSICSVRFTRVTSLRRHTKGKHHNFMLESNIYHNSY